MHMFVEFFQLSFFFFFIWRKILLPKTERFETNEFVIIRWNLDSLECYGLLNIPNHLNQHETGPKVILIWMKKQKKLKKKQPQNITVNHSNRSETKEWNQLRKFWTSNSWRFKGSIIDSSFLNKTGKLFCFERAECYRLNKLNEKESKRRKK